MLGEMNHKRGKDMAHQKNSQPCRAIISSDLGEIFFAKRTILIWLQIGFENMSLAAMRTKTFYASAKNNKITWRWFRLFDHERPLSRQAVGKGFKTLQRL